MAGDKTSRITQRFSEGVAAYTRAKASFARGDFDRYEQDLGVAVCSATGALEWTLKAHLRFHTRRARMSEEEVKRLKQPTFEVLVSLMKVFGEPILDESTAGRFFDFRQARNQAEHDAAIPSIRTVEDILEGTRQAISTWLEEDGLSPFVAEVKPVRTLCEDRDALPNFLRIERKVAGRKSEIADITRALERSAADRTGAIILIRGASGTGKSFLSQEAWRVARQLGFDVATTICEPFNEGMVLFPIQELVCQITRSSSLTAAIEEHFAPTSSQASIARFTEEPGADPVQRRDAILATFANALYGRFAAGRRMSAKPVLLIIDDLEWIDSSTVDAILCLRSRFAEGPVVVLGCYRTDLVHAETPGKHALSSLIGVAKRNRQQSLIVDVDGLPESDLPKVVEGVLDAPCDLPRRFYDRLYRETEGNPLFVREVLRTLTGSLGEPNLAPLQKIEGRWNLVREGDEWEIPATIEEAISARLRYLDDLQLAELEKAAVIGRHFAYEVFAQIASTSEDLLTCYLERLIDIDIIKEIDDDDLSFGFTHGKIRDVIYNSIPKFKRQRLHRAIAEVLKLMSAQSKRASWVPLIGNHLFQAGAHAEACEYLLQAARSSVATCAIHQAAEQYERVLESGCRSTFPSYIDESALRAEYAQALKLAGFYVKAIATLTQVCEKSDSKRTRCESLNALGHLYWLTGKMDLALSQYEECLAIANQSSFIDIAMETCADLHEYHDREAERLAGADPRLSSSHRSTSEFYLDAQLSALKQGGSNKVLCRAKRNEAKWHRRYGRLREAIDCYEVAIGLEDSNVSSHGVLISYAKTLRLVGRASDAWGVVERVYQWGIQTGSRRTEAIARQYKGILWLEKEGGEAFESAKMEIDSAIAIHEELGYDRGIREVQMLLGEYHALRLEWELALQCFGRCVGLGSNAPSELVNAAVAQLQSMGEPTRADRLGRRAEELGLLVNRAI